MSIKRRVARAVAGAASHLRRDQVPSGHRALMYHAIGTPLEHDTYGISLTPDAFRRQMELLAAESNGQVLPFGPIATGAAPYTIAITFDDGYRDNLTEAAPVLLELGLPFTVFVTSGFVNDSKPGCLSVTELRELAALPGVTIGAHGATHGRLTECNAATLQRELQDSRAYLEDVTGRAVATMAYPHGAVDGRVRAAVAGAGYSAAGCSRYGSNGPQSDPLLLRRIEIVAGDNEVSFLQKLRGAWDWRR